MFCDLRDIFGEVGKGVHSIRIFNIAIVDVLLTILGAYILFLMFPFIDFFTILLILFILGIVAHRIFCVRTTVDKMLFK